MKKSICFLAAMTILALGTGCTPRMAGQIFNAAIVTAAVVGTAAILAHHDSHYHHYHCGCRRHWHQGNWVYYYNYGWEYYDPHANVWYRYN